MGLTVNTAFEKILYIPHNITNKRFLIIWLAEKER